MDYFLTGTGTPACINHTCDKPVATFDQLSSNPLPENDDAYPRMIIHEPTANQKSPFFLLPAGTPKHTFNEHIVNTNLQIELRNHVYNYMFPQKAMVEWGCDKPYTDDHRSWECEPNPRCAFHSGNVPKLDGVPKQERTKPPSQLGILLSCRQIWHEAAATALSSLNLDIINLSSCRNWKKTLVTIPVQHTTRFPLLSTLQIVQPRR